MPVRRLHDLKARRPHNSTKSQRNRIKRLNRRRKIDWGWRKMRWKWGKKRQSEWKRKPRDLRNFQGAMKDLEGGRVLWKGERAARKMWRISSRFTVSSFEKISSNFPLIFRQFKALHRQTNGRRFSMFSGVKDLTAKKKKNQFWKSQGQTVIQARAVAESWAASNKS